MEEKVSSGRGLAWIVGLVVAAPLLYVLSVGPAVAVVSRTGQGEEVARMVYAPVIWLHDNTPLKKPLQVYVDLWEKK